MKTDDTHAALVADVHAINRRILAQMDEDPDHLVALAMFQADLRRARMALLAHEQHMLPARRRYINGTVTQ